MKKVLSIVLAVMMLATVAFAAVDKIPGDIYPGETYAFKATPWAAATHADTGTVPVVEIVGTMTAAPIAPATWKTTLSTGNFSVINVSWSEGKTYVESVKINDDDNTVDLKLKQNYTLIANGDAVADTGSKYLKGGFTLRQKSTSDAGAKYVLGLVGGAGDPAIGYGRIIMDASAAGDDTAISDVDVLKINEIQAAKVAYSNLIFPCANGEEVQVRVYDKEKYFLKSTNKADNKILVANADVDYDYITFLNFPAKPTFSTNATIFFYNLDEDAKIYENKDGKLTKADAKWDDDNACWTLKARTLGSYVASDATLIAAEATDPANPDTSNPDTGANDVVGIASALAVVALVSAAAVSLKK